MSASPTLIKAPTVHALETSGGVTNRDDNNYVTLNVGGETRLPLKVSSCGPRAVVVFFISYYMHASLAVPVAWPTSHMVDELTGPQFRTVGKYILHDMESRMDKSTPLKRSRIVLQEYPQNILHKLQAEWWLAFQERLDTGKIDFQDVITHDS
jgi:hypothetical protein